MPLNPFRPMRPQIPGVLLVPTTTPTVAPPNLNPALGGPALPGQPTMFPTAPPLTPMTPGTQQPYAGAPPLTQPTVPPGAAGFGPTTPASVLPIPGGPGLTAPSGFGPATTAPPATTTPTAPTVPAYVAANPAEQQILAQFRALGAPAAPTEGQQWIAPGRSLMTFIGGRWTSSNERLWPVGYDPPVNPPATPAQGQRWRDPSSNIPYVFLNGEWWRSTTRPTPEQQAQYDAKQRAAPVAQAQAPPGAPTNPTLSQAWYNPATRSTWRYSRDGWHEDTRTGVMVYR